MFIPCRTLHVVEQAEVDNVADKENEWKATEHQLQAMKHAVASKTKELENRKKELEIREKSQHDLEVSRMNGSELGLRFVKHLLSSCAIR